MLHHHFQIRVPAHTLKTAQYIKRKRLAGTAEEADESGKQIPRGLKPTRDDKN
jgi:hypothetical protein